MLQFPIAMTPRTEPARALAWLSPVIAFALTVFTGFCLFAALGQDPVKALGVFFIAPLDSLRGWTEIAVKMTPLLLCAAGLVVCFKANVWNIGAEGQLIAGAITGGVVALACDPSWGRWYVVLVMLASQISCERNSRFSDAGVCRAVSARLVRTGADARSHGIWFPSDEAF